MPKSKVVAAVIARTVSTRLPLKVLRSVDQHNTMLEYIVKRLKLAKNIDEIYICTSSEPVDDIMEDIAQKAGVKVYRGSSDKVIERMLDVSEQENADIILRITGDNVFTSYEYIDQQINAIQAYDLDYVRLVDVPVGATAEVMRTSALRDCMTRIDPAVSEYLMLFMFEPSVFKCGIIKPFEEDYSNMSLTVDKPEDLVRTKEIINHYNKENKEPILLDEIISLVKQHAISNVYFDNSGSTIKYPYGKVISIDEFQADMNRRKAHSTLIPQ